MRLSGAFNLVLTLGILASCGKGAPDAPSTVERQTKDISYLPLEDNPRREDWPKRKAVFYHWMTPPSSLHPTNGVETGKLMVFDWIHRRLLYMNLKQLRPAPDLAEKLPEVSEDGLKYSFTIRQEAKWDDGSPIIGQDVAFTYKAFICPLVNNPGFKAYLDQVEAVETFENQPKRVDILMKSPYIFNDYIHCDIVILQQSLYDPEGVLNSYRLEDFRSPDFMASLTNPKLESWANAWNEGDLGSKPQRIQGAGPYRLASWTPGSEMLLVRKKNHWTQSLNSGEDAHLSRPDSIVVRTILDEQALELEIKRQGIDASNYISTALMERLVNDSNFLQNYHGKFVESFSYSFIAFNTKARVSGRNPALEEPEVRKALAHLTPVQKIIDVVYQGHGTPMAGPVSPRKPWYNDQINPRGFSPEKAKKLLESSGWKDNNRDGILEKPRSDGQILELRFELAYNQGSPVTQTIADLIRQEMNKHGVMLRLAPMSGGALQEAGSQHNFDLLMTAFGGTAGADDFKQLWHTESWTGNGANYSGFGNESTDALIDSLRIERNHKKRTEMYQRFQALVYEACPWVPLQFMDRKIIIHKRLHSAAMYFERPGLWIQELAPEPALP